jgi:hypothetical protein
MGAAGHYCTARRRSERTRFDSTLLHKMSTSTVSASQHFLFDPSSAVRSWHRFGRFHIWSNQRIIQSSGPKPPPGPCTRVFCLLVPSLHRQLGLQPRILVGLRGCFVRKGSATLYLSAAQLQDTWTRGFERARNSSICSLPRLELV